MFLTVQRMVSNLWLCECGELLSSSSGDGLLRMASGEAAGVFEESF